jgi:hypothetical protein
MTSSDDTSIVELQSKRARFKGMIQEICPQKDEFMQAFIATNSAYSNDVVEKRDDTQLVLLQQPDQDKVSLKFNTISSSSSEINRLHLIKREL